MIPVGQRFLFAGRLEKFAKDLKDDAKNEIGLELQDLYAKHGVDRITVEKDGEKWGTVTAVFSEPSIEVTDEDDFESFWQATPELMVMKVRDDWKDCFKEIDGKLSYINSETGEIEDCSHFLRKTEKAIKYPKATPSKEFKAEFEKVISSSNIAGLLGE